MRELPVSTPHLRPVAEACPGCGQLDGVEQTRATGRVEAWQCRCGMSWAISLVNPHLRDRADDYAEQVRVARWILGQVVQLRRRHAEVHRRRTAARLLALANGAR